MSKNFWGKLLPVLLGLTLFVAFWQWRHTFHFAYIGERYFEYGSLHVYAADVLALASLILAAAIGWKRVVLGRAVIGWACALLVWMGVSILWSQATAPALVRFAEFWLWSLFAYVVASYVVQLLHWLIGGVLMSAVVGVGQYILNHSLGLQAVGESVLKPEELGMPVVIDQGVRQVRASGLTPHPNILGGILVWCLSWLNSAADSIKSKYGWYLFSAALCGGVLVMAWARGAWLAGVLVGGAAICFAARSNAKAAIGIWSTGLGVALAFVLLWNGVSADRLLVGGAQPLEQQSIEDRLNGIESWKKIAKDNWLLGVGPGNYTFELGSNNPAWPEWELQPVHNVYLLWLAETGLVGFIIVVFFGWQVVGYIRRKRVALVRVLPMVAWLILGLFDHWPITMHQGYVGLFLALALIFAEGDVS